MEAKGFHEICHCALSCKRNIYKVTKQEAKVGNSAAYMKLHAKCSPHAFSISI